jgi:hypothetical protein
MRRRRFLLQGALGAGALLAPGALRARGVAEIDDLADAADTHPQALARDEAFWRRFRAGYALPRGEVNLDNAAGAPTSRHVSNALARYARETPAWSRAEFARALEAWDRDFSSVLQSQALGDDAEWLLVRNATEALVMVILGVPLQRGDEIVVTSHEYETIVDAWRCGSGAKASSGARHSFRSRVRRHPRQSWRRWSARSPHAHGCSWSRR